MKKRLTRGRSEESVMKMKSKVATDKRRRSFTADPSGVVLPISPNLLPLVSFKIHWFACCLICLNSSSHLETTERDKWNFNNTNKAVVRLMSMSSDAPTQMWNVPPRSNYFSTPDSFHPHFLLSPKLTLY